MAAEEAEQAIAKAIAEKSRRPRPLNVRHKMLFMTMPQAAGKRPKPSLHFRPQDVTTRQGARRRESMEARLEIKIPVRVCPRRNMRLPAPEDAGLIRISRPPSEVTWITVFRRCPR
jgi:hypothetical protein